MLPKNQIELLYSALGNRVKELRINSNYSQSNFANLLEISRASLVNIEKGRQRPPLHLLYDIARLLEVSINDLLPRKEEVNEDSFRNSILNKIQETSAGNSEIEKRLRGFVKTSRSSYE